MTIEVAIAYAEKCRVITCSSSGWRRRGIAFMLGVMATLALPPFFLFPFLIPSLVGFLWLLDSSASRKSAFMDGWWWGFGHFTTGLYWMCIALLTDPVKFGWLIPFTLGGLNGVIALYTGVVALIIHVLRMKLPLLRVVAFACIWTLVEFARGTLFTGFPWNLIGYSWAGFESVIQAASVTGIYGLSFITVLVAAIPFTRNKRAIMMVWGAFVLMVAAGAWRLHIADERPYGDVYVQGVQLRLVQANISQPHKWDPRLQMSGLRSHLELSRSEGYQAITHIIWPETAIPFALNISRNIVSMLYDVVPDNGALLSGTLRASAASQDADVWNSMAVIPQTGEGISYYDKHHLVPFGEFVPFRAWLPMDKITPGTKDFSTGPGPSSISILNVPNASPLICYEAIFPGRAVDETNRPGWMVNITNDAWFGMSTGPYQHYYMTKLRAVEEGIPLVRAANTGISAVVDAYGRTLKSLPLGSKGVLDSPLPTALSEPTFYSRSGNIYLLVLMQLLLIVSWLADRQKYIKI